MAAEHRNALPVGAEFEGYRIESILGAGGFGITYKALELSIDREVAIKEYLPKGVAMREGDSRTVSPIDSASTDDFEWGLDRFRQEAKVLVALKHPNIVPVLRFFEANNTAYMVMEYQHGMSLGQVLRRDGTLEEDEIRELLFPIIDGLSVIHGAGFLHRDIKPDNIFIRGDGTPVLIDFGSARQSLSEHSRSITAIISEGYAPYEQYQGGGERSPATDIYSLGATLYRCMTGDRPPDAPTRINSSIQGKRDPLVPAASAAKGRYSKGLMDAVDAALQIVESDRPQSVEAFRAMLEERDSGAAAFDTPTPSPFGEAGERRPPQPPSESRRGFGGFGPRHAIAAGLIAVFLAVGGAAAFLFIGDGEDGSSGVSGINSGSGTGVRGDPGTMGGDPDAEAQRRAEEEAQRRAEEEAERRRREEEAQRRAEEEAQRRQEEEAQRRAEAARQREQAEAEERRRREQAQRERARQRAEAETAESESAATDAEAELRQYFSSARGYMTKELSVGFGPANVQIDFRSGGRLRVSWEVASVDTFRTETVDGSWSVQGNQLCMRIPRIDGGAERCYTVVNRSPANCRLRGNGELSGNMQVTR